MVVNKLSQRRLAAAIGVESGTFTKYFRGAVDPYKIGLAIQAALATQLGVTLDALVQYYSTGEYLSGVSPEAVESWIRSEAGQEDLPVLLSALQEAGQRWCASDRRIAAAALSPYEWPAEVVDRSGLPIHVLEGLGIHAESLNRLIDAGEIDDDLVKGFAVLLKAEPEEVRAAFEERVPLG